MRKFGMRFGAIAASLVIAALVGSSYAEKVVVTLTSDLPGIDAEGNLACDPEADPVVDEEFGGTGDVTLSVNTKNGKARVKIKGTATNASGATAKFKDSPDVLECTLALLGLDELPEGVTIDHTSYSVTKKGKVKGSAKGTIDPELIASL